jgi:ribosomal protein L11 methyltransferase
MTLRFRTTLDLSCLEAIEAYIYSFVESPWVLFFEKPNDRIFTLEGYFQSQDTLCPAWKALKAACSLPENPYQIETLQDADWQNAYKAFLRPWSYEVLHWVPLWQKGDYSQPEGHYILWVDAGMAFGTGAHETTQLCGRRLVDFYAHHPKGKQSTIIDAGCGSGILALSAALLGFQEIYAFDNDPQAIIVCKENAELNNLAERVNFQVAHLQEGLHHRKADLLLANIQADVLLPQLESLLEAIAPEGQLVLSGVLAAEIDRVRKAFEEGASRVWADTAFKSTSFLAGEWGDLCLERLDR